MADLTRPLTRQLTRPLSFPVDAALTHGTGGGFADELICCIPADQAQASLDPQGRAAACIMAGVLRCFFVPLNG